MYIYIYIQLDIVVNRPRCSELVGLLSPHSNHPRRVARCCFVVLHGGGELNNGGSLGNAESQRRLKRAHKITAAT